MTFLDAPPLGFAHRGGAAVGDENTTAAFARAVDLGYRYIETDTHATADGVAVVFHDHRLDRLLGRPGTISDLRWADLATLRVAGAGTVPRLDDILDTWPDTRFNIDIKSDDAVEPTLASIRRSRAERRVLLASFSDRRLANIRRTAGDTIANSLGIREVATLWSGLMGRGRPVPPGAVAVQVPPRHGRLRIVTPRFVARAHRLGLQVHVWTIDDARQMRYFLDLGVDGIMTDRIEVLREVYRERGHWAD